MRDLRLEAEVALPDPDPVLEVAHRQTSPDLRLLLAKVLHVPDLINQDRVVPGLIIRVLLVQPIPDHIIRVLLVQPILDHIILVPRSLSIPALQDQRVLDRRTRQDLDRCIQLDPDQHTRHVLVPHTQENLDQIDRDTQKSPDHLVPTNPEGLLILHGLDLQNLPQVQSIPVRQAQNIPVQQARDTRVRDRSRKSLKRNPVQVRRVVHDLGQLRDLRLREGPWPIRARMLKRRSKMTIKGKTDLTSASPSKYS